MLVGVIHADVLEASFSSVGLNIEVNSIGNQYIESHWYLNTNNIRFARRYLANNSQSALGKADIDLLYAIDLYPSEGCAVSEAPQWWGVQRS